MSGKEIRRWSDEAMFTAEKTTSTTPEVYILQGTPDPLGSIAAFAAMYIGKVVRNKADVTDEERRYYLEEMQQTKLKAPLEAVNLHFMVEGVTRSFTHQMVRQRTAVYAQESLRFAVKEDASEAVATPPFLAGTVSLDEWCDAADHDSEIDPEQSPLFERENEKQQMRLIWDYANRDVADVYNHLVNKGMPAEDARGLLPHNITTRLNYATNLRNLQDHSGNRLCTQAQFEWRMFWVKITAELRNYCTDPRCHQSERRGQVQHSMGDNCDNWQWKEIANLFRPVCYFTGKCEFKAKFDRHCNIRDRVELNAENGVPSTEWGTEHYTRDGLRIDGISPAEWLMDDGAARKSGSPF